MTISTGYELYHPKHICEVCKKEIESKFIQVIVRKPIKQQIPAQSSGTITYPLNSISIETSWTTNNVYSGTLTLQSWQTYPSEKTKYFFFHFNCFINNLDKVKKFIMIGEILDE
uniref:Uncharacterized protein n=1 Tax=viral metagenome TaxID=1070528 RepID=A0A6H1ZY88_9ZZZZ